MPGQELAQHKLRSSSDPSWAEACPCHGVPGNFQRDPRYRNGGFWRCREDWNARERDRHANLDPAAYARRYLQKRRWRAVQRMTARERRR